MTWMLRFLHEACAHLLNARPTGALHFDSRVAAVRDAQEQLVAFYLSAVAERMDAQQAGTGSAAVDWPGGSVGACLAVAERATDGGMPIVVVDSRTERWVRFAVHADRSNE
eukprot:999254-Pleurochrysis_carterae.AAC.2